MKQAGREEEKLAAEALGLFRAWVQEHKNADPGKSPCRVRMKFCGGCNPVLDRSWIAQQIRVILENDIRWVGAEEDADVVLILNGCLIACADRPEVRKQGRYYLTLCPEAVLAIRGIAEG
jgi:hypothetical protein